MEKTTYNEIKNANAIEWKEALTPIELLGIKFFIEKEFKGKGKKAYEYSTFTSHNGNQLDFTWSIGTTGELVIKDSTNVFHSLKSVRLANNGALFGITTDGKTIKIDVEYMTL